MAVELPPMHLTRTSTRARRVFVDLPANGRDLSDALHKATEALPEEQRTYDDTISADVVDGQLVLTAVISEKSEELAR